MDIERFMDKILNFFLGIFNKNYMHIGVLVAFLLLLASIGFLIYVAIKGDPFPDAPFPELIEGINETINAS